jgi:alpha-beta hydrolase superfamily lysophospholipase
MPSEHILHFTSDGLNLVGTLHLPDRPLAPVVIGCHGLLADRSSPKQISLARACNREKLAYFRFDHRGCGDSQGDFGTVTSLEARCRDLKSAMERLQHQSVVGPVACVFGSSFGGTVVLSLAAQIADQVTNQVTLPALITYAAPINHATIQVSAIRDKQGRPVNPGWLPENMAFDITDRLDRITNLLVSHGQFDETVPLDHARTIFKMAREPKKLLIQKGGDHRMSDRQHQLEFEGHFLSWIKAALYRATEIDKNGIES